MKAVHTPRQQITAIESKISLEPPYTRLAPGGFIFVLQVEALVGPSTLRLEQQQLLLFLLLLLESPVGASAFFYSVCFLSVLHIACLSSTLS